MIKRICLIGFNLHGLALPTHILIVLQTENTISSHLGDDLE
jgi:hypothetical protein